MLNVFSVFLQNLDVKGFQTSYKGSIDNLRCVFRILHDQNVRIFFFKFFFFCFFLIVQQMLLTKINHMMRAEEYKLEPNSKLAYPLQKLKEILVVNAMPLWCSRWRLSLMSKSFVIFLEFPHFVFQKVENFCEEEKNARMGVLSSSACLQN